MGRLRKENGFSWVDLDGLNVATCHLQASEAELASSNLRESTLMAEKNCLWSEVQSLNDEIVHAKETETTMRDEIAALKLELAQSQDALRDASLKMHQQVRQ